MEQVTLNFSANEQALNPPNSQYNFASNTVSYIKAVFDLGENWSGYDSVRAVWNTDFECISTVLDSDNSCIVPQEVLKRTGSVMVNLVGSIVEDDELTDRLTTYPSVALTVNANAKICGTETAPITPSQFEQYVAMVVAEVEKVTGMTATAVALPEGSAPTAVYENGVLTLGIPKGDKGDTGNGISSVVFNADYSLTFNFTESEPYTTPSIRGERGAQGYGIVSVEKIGTAGLVDTYQVNYEDPSVPPTTFTVTNGAKGDAGNGISSVTKTGTAGLVDTYRITFTNGGHYDFNVTNGAKGDTGATGNGIATIAKTSTSGLVDTYTITFTDGTTTTFEVTNGQDGEVTFDELSELLPTETASGDIASFNDGQAVIPAVSVVATITPIQSGSGTPSPSNVRPITGWSSVKIIATGISLFDESVSVDNSRFTTTSISYVSGLSRSEYIEIKPNETYYFRGVTPNNSGYSGVFWYDEDKAFISASGVNASTATTPANLSATAPSGAKYVGINFFTTNKSDVSVNYPSTDTSYHAYNGTTHTTTLPSTTYGGTLDLVSGVMTVTHGVVDLSSGMTYVSVGAGGGWYKELQSQSKTVADSEIAPITAEAYTPIRYNGVFSNTGTIAVRGAINTVYANTGSQSVTPTGKAIYELATPTTYQLTPQQIDTLKGQNNITATSGQVSVTYKADIQKYIDNAIATALA